ncbi:TNF receptor-associated factor 1, partial [Ophiophagus hannah]
MSEESSRSPSKATLNKEIPEFAVHCGIPGCIWRGPLSNLEDHRRMCEYVLVNYGQAAVCQMLMDVNAGRHLLLLLQYVKHLKGNSSPRGSLSNSPLIDAKLWMKSPLTLKIQDPGGERSFSASPVEEGEVSWVTLLRRVKRVSWLETKLQVFENIASVLSKEMVTSRQKILAFHLQRCLAQKDATLLRLGKRLGASEQVSYDGVFLWKITDVHQKCYEAICGKSHGFQSPAFYTSRYGYKLCMRIYLNGEGKGRGTHISLFLILLKGDYDSLLPWPFTHK